MPVRQRHGKWVIDCTAGGRRFRRTVPVETREEADALARAACERLMRGEDPEEALRPPPRRRLEDLTVRLHSLRWAGSKNERSVVCILAEIGDWFGRDTDPAEITADRVDQFVLDMRSRRNNSNATINRKLSVLRMLLEHARNREWIDRVPEIPTLREADEEVRYLTVEDEARVLEHLHHNDPDLWRIAVFMVDTGARAGEAARLRWEHVDLDRGSVSFTRTKSGRPRSVPLTRRAADVLRGARPEDRIRNPTVFPGWLDRRGCVTPLSARWRAAAAAVGLDRRLHDLRHTFASRLAQRGAGIQAIQQLLGHSSIQTTMRYAHLAPNSFRGVVGLLDTPEPGHEPDPDRLSQPANRYPIGLCD